MSSVGLCKVRWRLGVYLTALASSPWSDNKVSILAKQRFHGPCLNSKWRQGWAERQRWWLVHLRCEAENGAPRYHITAQTALRHRPTRLQQRQVGQGSDFHNGYLPNPALLFKNREGLYPMTMQRTTAMAEGQLNNSSRRSSTWLADPLSPIESRGRLGDQQLRCWDLNKYIHLQWWCGDAVQMREGFIRCCYRWLSCLQHNTPCSFDRENWIGCGVNLISEKRVSTTSRVPSQGTAVNYRKQKELVTCMAPTSFRAHVVTVSLDSLKASTNGLGEEDCSVHVSATKNHN